MSHDTYLTLVMVVGALAFGLQSFLFVLALYDASNTPETEQE